MNSDDKKPATLTRTEAAEALGISPQGISYHVRAGAIRRNRDGTFSAIDIEQFKKNRDKPKQASKAKSDKEAADLRWRLARAKREETLTKKLLGELISTNEVSKGWVERVGLVVSGLNALIDRLPPILEGKSRAEMRELIKAEVYELRRAYAEEGEYCPKAN